MGGVTPVRYADDGATAAAAFVATAFCARAALRQAGRARVSWWLFAGACAAWTLGECLWGGYDVVQGSVPVPSWADVGYLAATPLAAAALLVHPAMRGRTIGKARSALDALVIAVALFLVSWTFVLEPLWSRADMSTVGGGVTAAYPIGDVVLVFLIVLVIRGTVGTDRSELWLLLGGLLALTLSDSTFGYLTEVRHFATGNVVDTGWFAGYLAIAVAAHLSRSAAGSDQPIDARALSSAAIVAPFLPLFAALSLTAIRIELGHRLDRVSLLQPSPLPASCSSDRVWSSSI